MTKQIDRTCTASHLADLTDLATPAMVIDAMVVRRNLERLTDYCVTHRLALRPHTKTHKSRHVAKMQLEAGAIGLAAAKVGEATVLADLTDDLLLAYPPVDAERARQLAVLGRDRKVRLAIDSSVALEIAVGAARHEPLSIGLLVDLDVGLGRTGVQSPQQALALAQSIDSAPDVRLDGILIYPGHIWDPPERQGPALKAVANLLEETIDLWRRHGLAAPVVSGGSTPTAYQSHQVSHLTEIRPGTNIYNDMNTVHGGFCRLEDCAVRLVCTVISDAVAGQVVLDAGSKTLTSDRCLPAPDSGHGYIVEYPKAKITHLSEEHGQVDITACEENPRVGERLTVIPNHVCPCVNLHDAVWWIQPNEAPRSMVIEGRGKIT